jgi:hypothetical protein
MDEEEAAPARPARVPARLPAHQERVIRVSDENAFLPLLLTHAQNPAVEDNNLLPQVRPGRLEIIADQAANVDEPQAEQLPTPPQSPVPQARIPARQNLGRVGVQRKPLTSDCYICYEPFEGPDDAVWCRRRCGQNAHKGCFEEWSRGKERWEVKCGFW